MSSDFRKKTTLKWEASYLDFLLFNKEFNFLLTTGMSDCINKNKLIDFFKIVYHF